MNDSLQLSAAVLNSLDAAVAAERARWLKAVVSETFRKPAERWANELNGDYNAVFYETRAEAEAAALRYVEQRNKT